MDVSDKQNTELIARFRTALKKSFLSKRDFCMAYLLNLDDLEDWMSETRMNKGCARAALKWMGEDPDKCPLESIYKINCDKYMMDSKCDKQLCEKEHSFELRTELMIQEMHKRAAKETVKVTLVDADRWKWKESVGTVIFFRSPHSFTEKSAAKGHIRTEMFCQGSKASAMSFEAALLHATLPLTVEFIIVSDDPFALELLQRLRLGKRPCKLGKEDGNKISEPLYPFRKNKQEKKP